MKSLTHVDLRGCHVKDLSFLKPLTDLKYLMLADNDLADLMPMVEMCAAERWRTTVLTVLGSSSLWKSIERRGQE